MNYNCTGYVNYFLIMCSCLLPFLNIRILNQLRLSFLNIRIVYKLNFKKILLIINKFKQFLVPLYNNWYLKFPLSLYLNPKVKFLYVFKYSFNLLIA